MGVLLVAAAAGGGASGQDYRLETVAGAPPQELAAGVREALAGEALRVVGPEGPVCEIWVRKTVPAVAPASPSTLGIAYPQIPEGTLLGAIRFLSDARDYRRQRVKPGVYTLRYALHPTDGNHLGIAPQRDFMLLVPAAADAGPAAIPRDELMAFSRQASGAGHPSVWSLRAEESEAGAVPGLTQTEEENWVLRFRTEFEAKDGSKSGQVMGLVVVGSAPEA